MKSPRRHLLVYLALLIGAALFVLPFLWMLSTSMKQDRELFTADLRLLPGDPNPRPASPYVDDTQTARQLLLGPVRVRSASMQDVELLPDSAPVARWTSASAVASTSPATQQGLDFVQVQYDFARGDQLRLVLQSALPFKPADLQRIQLRLQPDDTWHALRATLELNGRKYRAARSEPLAGLEWQTLTWQFPSEDDQSTQIKTWILLDPDGNADTALPAEHVRLTLTIDRVTPMEARYAKAILNYRRTADQIPFWRYLRVSLFLVVANIVLTLLASSLVAYAFARISWPGREAAFVLMLATLMIPSQVTMIPHFLIWKSVGAYDTLTPLWLPSLLGSAFFIFMMRQFMKGVPRELEDAARIDGCGFLRIWWHVMLPMVKPCLAAIAVMTFMNTWNDFLGPLIYIADQRLYPLAFGLYAFAVQIDSNPPLTMAAAVLMTLPVIGIFLLAQRYFIEGITLTGLKG